MRINRFVASATGMSRRAADTAIADGRVLLNGAQPTPGSDVGAADIVTIDGRNLTLPDKILIMLNKPVGYVSSRAGQGGKTIYDLLPNALHHLKPIGRLDKDSSGLLLLTNDGELANRLTHPRYRKEKIYEVELDRPLSVADKAKIESGVILEEGPSALVISKRDTGGSNNQKQNSFYVVRLSEGRNRQIRRTFKALGYTVIKLHRTQFGPHILPARLKLGQYINL